jgi:hypothetical protein
MISEKARSVKMIAGLRAVASRVAAQRKKKPPPCAGRLRQSLQRVI